MEATFFGPGGPVRFQDQVQGNYVPPSAEDLIVHPLSASQWRVCDRRYSEHDACSLLGFIEEKDNTFELTQLEHGFQWFYFSSLPEAIAHFSQPAHGEILPQSKLSSSASND